MRDKFFISPSSQPHNMYAVGGVSEEEQCRAVAKLLGEALKRCGFEVMVGFDGTMYTRVAESNEWNAAWHIPYHTNAFNGAVKGTRLMVYELGGEAEKMARCILNRLAPITPGSSDSITAHPEIYEIKASNALCVYIESVFHDTVEEALWHIEHQKDIAEAICRGICDYEGVEYIPAGGTVRLFADVDTAAWYAQSVAYCVANGIMVGDPDGKFRPDDPITRAEVAAVAERLHKLI
jgi:N-acetylmuramoyl-L-alanine amidase